TKYRVVPRNPCVAESRGTGSSRGAGRRVSCTSEKVWKRSEPEAKLSVTILKPHYEGQIAARIRCPHTGHVQTNLIAAMQGRQAKAIDHVRSERARVKLNGRVGR